MQWGNRDIVLRSPTVNWQNHPILEGNPNLMAELQIMINSLYKLGYAHVGFSWSDAMVLHQKYYTRFINEYLTPIVKSNGGIFPHLNKTRAIEELIARGWVHEDEAGEINKIEEVYISCTIAPLVWPKSYFYHQNALEIASKIGIPGYTKTNLPKS